MGKRIHMIGMCGLGMSSVALLLKEEGNTVTGSDAECYGPPQETLAVAGLTPLLPYSPSNIPADVDEFIIGRNAKLVRTENAEVEAAYQTGKPIYSFPEVLGRLTKNRRNVVVAGSYGKSTTTALLAHILRHAGLDAGYFVGAEPVADTPAKIGTHELFVLEGDEYPSGHDDARPKFLHLHPTDVLLSSAVHDHVNVYPTHESYLEAFRQLLALVPDNGTVTVCADQPDALTLAQASGKNLVTYGVTNGMYAARDMSFDGRISFTLIKEGEPVIALTSELLGKHNVENIVAVSAYVLSRNLMAPEALAAAVADFKGVRRRLDKVANSSIPMHEGFGSSYEKARAAIEALKLHFPNHRLVVVFEPHTFGWRNRANLPWYDNAFAGAGLAFIAAPETQGATTHDQLSHEEILERAKAAGVDARPYDANNRASVLDAIEPNDVVLVLTSGDLHGSLPSLVRDFEERFPA
ncbi:MAG: UDP-N-acetylmuramate--alanine ligase [Parcubacteria bacterium C7867-001]|nr:MAG: UDP-N-acetylmuramate--alanine ligase [Parcubacteria bacterium C7867-001]